MKKALVIFSVLIITLLCSISVLAADTDDSGMWEYQTYGSGVELTSYKGTQTDVYVPSKITKGETEYSVIKLGDELFKGNTSLNSATLGEGITEIGASSFEGATNLVCIVTPESLTTIGDSAFSGCSNFNSVILKKAVVNIADNTFESCAKLKIYCEDNSTAKTYAEKESIPYVLISEEASPQTSVINDITYYVGNGEAILMKCLTSKSGAVVIPSEVEGFPVTKINNNAFKECTKITSVFIPDTITYIGNSAFYKCSALRTANIPKGLKEIPAEMFGSCYQLNNLEIPYGVTKIGGSAFSFCYQVTKLVLPETVTSIGRHAFWYAYRLSSVNIPSGVTELGEGAFYMNKFSSVELPKMLKTIPTDLFMDCVNLKSITIPQGVTLIDSGAFDGCTGLTEVVVPEGVTRIAYCAFRDCTSLRTVTLPTTLKDMHNNTAFSGCNAITDVYYNGSKTQWNNIPEIKSSILYSKNVYFAVPSPILNFSLSKTSETLYMGTSFKLTPKFVPEYPDNETIIWESSNTSVATVTDGVVSGIGIGTSVITATTEDGGFTASCTVSVELPRGTTGSLTWYVSENNTLYIEGNGSMPNYSSGTAPWYDAKNLFSKVIVGKGVTSIGSYAFYECSNVTSIVIPDTVTKLSNYCFYNCSLLSDITLPEGITSIPAYSFHGCRSLRAIVLPDSVTHIYDRAFYNSGLSVITIGKGLKRVNWQAFDGCSFSKVNTNDLAAWSVIDFEYSTSNPLSRGSGLLYYNGEPVYDVIIPEGTTHVGANFSGYKYLKSIFIPDSVTSLADSVFHNCTALAEVRLSNNIKTIPTYAFNNCSSLKSIAIPDSVTEIKDSVFSGCTSLESITLSKKLTTINRTAFYGCSALKAITFPDTLKTIGEMAFHSCKNIKELIIPDSVTSLGETAFYSCTSLKKVHIGTGLKALSNSMFQYCYELTEVTFSNTLTEIGNQIFYGCSKLTNIEFPDSLLTIGTSCFSGTALSECQLPKHLTTIGSSAFYGNAFSEIYIPETVTTIGSNAFLSCSNLTKVILCEGLTKIESGVFASCPALKTIIIPESVTSLDVNAFSGDTVILCVYSGSTAHSVALSNNIPYFVIKKTSNPEISYGKGIVGTVKDTKGMTISNATVEIIYDDGTVKETVTTDSQGNYEFAYAEVGRYSIRVTDSDGNTASEVVSVKRMNVFDVYVAGETDLVLKKGYNVSGTVSPDASKVTISDTSGNVIKSVDTTDGIFTFGDIPRGSYIVKAENETGSATTEIYVSNEDVTGISLEIQAQSATITGDAKIENRDGTFSAKIWVNIDLIDENGNVVANTKTDAECKYTFKNVPVGSYNIVATATEIRPDIIGGFDKNHELKGYGHIDVTEFITYTVDTIVLREEKINLTSVSGKVTANGTTQDCQVILTNENGDQIALFVTDKNGKYNFVNIPDGMYCITAITKNDGMGFAVITIKNSVVHGDTDIKVAKADKISKREPTLLSIPDCNTKEESLLYKEAVLAEKTFYDSLSDKERKQLSEEWLEKLFKLIALISDSSIQASEGVTVENVESVISSEEIDETIEFALSVTEVTAADAGEDGITTEEEYETEKIKDKKGKNKNIAKYYDITFSKDGQNISNIQKQTETNGKLRITMDIPEEYRGHKHYSFIHMHKGEAVTLVDLDDDPNTVTFEIEKFSTFALAYSDVELIGEVEETIYPASITYNAETGKISVSSTETGKLYIATYDGERLSSVAIYDVTANAAAIDYAFASNQVAFVWDENLRPLCEKFTISN